ncbi:hypothetical protein BDR05DRAFT_436433 [Suillus weaverae]|nr:hypothetical protein BDR05DRAFT_436433 [Suillus weaverae]
MVLPLPLLCEHVRRPSCHWITMRALAPTVLSTTTRVLMRTHSLTMTVRVCIPILLHRHSWTHGHRSDGYTPANNIVYTCGSTDITLTLYPGTISHIPK